jgi:hypothetical protein
VLSSRQPPKRIRGRPWITVVVIALNVWRAIHGPYSDEEWNATILWPANGSPVEELSPPRSSPASISSACASLHNISDSLSHGTPTGCILLPLHGKLPMPTARTQCPYCLSVRVSPLDEILYAPSADFFQCRSCRELWHTPKGENGPASRELLGQHRRSPSAIHEWAS